MTLLQAPGRAKTNGQEGVKGGYHPHYHPRAMWQKAGHPRGLDRLPGTQNVPRVATGRPCLGAGARKPSPCSGGGAEPAIYRRKRSPAVERTTRRLVVGGGVPATLRRIEIEATLPRVATGKPSRRGC